MILKSVQDMPAVKSGTIKLPAMASPTEATTGTDWPQPQPLPGELPSVSPFDFAMLPDTLRPWITDIADRMQCSPEYAAVGAIVALGSLIGRKVGIRPKRHDDWLIIPNLWGYVVGRPSLMKSPALEHALEPLRSLATEAREAFSKQESDFQADALLTKQRKKSAESKIAEHLKNGADENALNEARSAIRSQRCPPALRRYLVNDSTVEKLGELLKENPNGLLVHRDELMGFFRDMEKEGRESSRAFYVEAWNGTGGFTFDRIGRGTVHIEAVTISILGGIQPGPLSAYVRDAVRGGSGDDGLLSRFQIAVWPDLPMEWRNVDRLPDRKAKDAAFAVFKRLAGLRAQDVKADANDGIPFLRFSEEAQIKFDAWRATLEPRLRAGNEHAAFEAHLAKYRKLVPALALTLHLANRGTGPVTSAALEKSLLWAAYLESHARRIYAMALRPDLAAARELARHLQHGDLASGFTTREVYRKGWMMLSTVQDAEAAVELLAELGWLRRLPAKSEPHGRPTDRFAINPGICSCREPN